MDGIDRIIADTERGDQFEVGQRIQTSLGDRVTWSTCAELTALTRAADEAA